MLILQQVFRNSVFLVDISLILLDIGVIFLDITAVLPQTFSAHLQSSVFKLSKDLIDSIHEEGIVAYTS